MTEFLLKIVTPDGLIYEGQAQELIVRTLSGDMGILAGHINCVAALGKGPVTAIIDGQKRSGSCNGGIVSIMDGQVNLLPLAFAWTQ